MSETFADMPAGSETVNDRSIGSQEDVEEDQQRQKDVNRNPSTSPKTSHPNSSSSLTAETLSSKPEHNQRPHESGDNYTSKSNDDEEEDINNNRFSHSTMTSSRTSISTTDQRLPVFSTLARHVPRRQSSVELRQTPDHISFPVGSTSSVLGTQRSTMDSIEEGGIQSHTISNSSNHKAVEPKSTWLQKTCLKPKYSLLTQMMLSFGIVSALTIFFIMITSIVVTILAGNNIKNSSEKNLNAWANNAAGSKARYISEVVTPHLYMSDVVQTLVEFTRDRFVGYPNHPQYLDDDSLVPFFDMLTKENKYPFTFKRESNNNNKSSSSAPLLPYEWQIQPEQQQNQDDTLFRKKRKPRRPTNTATAYYHMQGMCDPSITDPNANAYYPNCTDANNDLSTGGVIVPNNTTALIAERGADLSIILKPLYEFHQDEIHNIGVFFKNSGAGFSISYPHINHLNYRHTYVSIGCDWMSNPNPMDPSRPIGTKDEIAKCRPKGTNVSAKLYNPLERDWCRDQVLHPDKVRHKGPYPDAWDENVWLMNAGRAIYDRKTKDFLACTFVGLSMDKLSHRVRGDTAGSLCDDEDEGLPSDWKGQDKTGGKEEQGGSRDESTLVGKMVDTEPIVTIVRWDKNGTVLTSPRWDYTSVTTVDNPILDIGVTIDIFRKMTSLVDFTGKWNSTKARRDYEESQFINDGKLIKCFPIPPIPDGYDKNYVPDFLAITSIAKSEYLKSAVEAEKHVHENINHMIIFTVTFGLAGLVLLLIIIYIVSMRLTRPLQWMNDVANQIVNGDDLDETNIEFPYNKAKTAASSTEMKLNSRHLFPRPSCTLTTELTDVVVEFQEMVTRFSGEGTARAVKRKPNETLNDFCFFAEFRKLYLSRKEKGFEFGYGDYGSDGSITTNGDNSSFLSESKFSEVTTTVGKAKNASDTVASTDEDQTSTPPLPSRCNFGPNVSSRESSIPTTNKDTEEIFSTSNTIAGYPANKTTSSRLFRWIAGLIVTPLMIVAVTMSVVAVTIGFSGENSQFSVLYADVENAFMNFEIQYQAATTLVRARQASDVLEVFLRDLFLLTRVSGWLLFGAIQPSDTITYMSTAAEGCKTSPSRSTCEYFFDESRTPCACDWNDLFTPHASRECTVYSNQSSRYLQRIFYECQAENSEPNGDRHETNFPNTSSTHNTTVWWSNITNLPAGKQEQESSSTAATAMKPPSTVYDSTYDRAKIVSALSTIMLPIYNKAPVKNIGSYVAFEADGSIAGFTGCTHAHADWPFFQSTIENGASELRPELCPLHRYGFDPRCRDWYHTGRKLFQNNSSPVYVTAPYVFAGSRVTGQSCSSPLFHPITKEHVGQTLIDFHPTKILESLKPANTRIPGNGFSFLMTVGGGKDAIVGPNYSLTDGPKSVQQIVLPKDQNKCSTKECVKNREEFEKILDDMRNGGSSGKTVFWRTSESGGIQEKLFISYAPVYARSFSPLNSSDFASGVKKSDSCSLVFSLAMASTEDELLKSFTDVEDDVEKQARRSIVVLAVLISASAILVLILSSSVAASITAIVVQLLEVIRSINRLSINDEIPELPATTRGGSSELLDIYHTFEMLHKVVRFSNVAYFTGDLETSYEVMADAVKLFTRLDNKKAVGVASNNLGNTMLAMYRTLKATGQNEMHGLTKEQIITKGLIYFRDAIKLGEEAYDKFYEEEGWSNNCLVFMQHLSNRYFNRAMFLLNVRNDSDQRDETERQGFRDLDIARNMDVEVVDQCVEAGFTIDRQEHFDLLLSRIRGILNLIELGYDRTELDVEELFAEAFREIKLALKNPSRGLFADIGRAGRMQQVDAELIKYINATKNDIEAAAQIAIRMLIEDEYVCSEPLVIALQTIADYVSKSNDFLDNGEDILLQLVDLHQLTNEENDRIETARAINEARDAEIGSFNGKLSKRITNVSYKSSSSHGSLGNRVSVKEIKRGDVTTEIF